MSIAYIDSARPAFSHCAPYTVLICSRFSGHNFANWRIIACGHNIWQDKQVLIL